MAEELNPQQEAQRIASTYLSKRGWTRQWRQGLNRQLYAGFQREEFEAKQRQCDAMEEEAEEFFDIEVERLRHDGSNEAKDIMAGIVSILGHRTDLGFIAKKIVARLKQETNPF